VTYGRFKVHPVADAFPLIEGEEFDALVADVDEHGLIEPIVLAPDGDTIVDGRNRYRACEKAGRDPVFNTLGPHYTDEEVVAYIISTNVRRRHLSVGQLSMIGQKIRHHVAEQAKERERSRKLGVTPSETTDPISGRENGRSAHQAAAQVGVTHTSITKAAKIEAVAPDLAAEVMAGTRTLEDGYKQAVVREKAAREKEDPKPKPTPVTIILRTHDGIEVDYPKPHGRATFNPTNDHISWAAWSWNPVTGCLHECRYCYARELATRPSYAATYPVGFMPLFHHERLDAPANTTVPADADQDPRRKRVFVCSMADLYGKWVPDEWICEVHGACLANPQWDYLFLTKFPSRYVDLDLPKTGWIGTSVDTQRRVAIAEHSFREISGVKVKWLSLEPLLEPLKFTDLSMFDWVVIGSQTLTVQPGNEVVPAFAPDFDWVASIVAQAREAGCAVYLKPNLVGNVGDQAPGMVLPQEVP
jgi:protein gp37